MDKPVITPEERAAQQRASNAAYAKVWRARNKEHLKEYRRAHYLKHAEVMRERSKEYRIRRVAADPDGFRRAEAERGRESYRRVMAIAPEKRRAASVEANKRRRQTESGRLYDRMRAGIRCALKRYAIAGKAGSSWVSLVGYTVEELVARLKKTLPTGYTWADFMAGKLHIEHIVPVSAFNFRSPECHDFKRCWALSNLRLLPVLENLRKGSKLLAPFQPSLI